MPNDKPTLFATVVEYLYCLLILLTLAAVFAVVFDLIAPIQAEQYWYSFTKDVPRSRVSVSLRPTDCDFSSPPTGSKGCHYRKVVDVEKDISGKTQVTVYWKKVSE